MQNSNYYFDAAKIQKFSYFCTRLASILFMKRYLKHYKWSLLLVAIIIVLSLYPLENPPLGDVPYIDKWTHVCMYGGLCLILWIEYLRAHQAINPWRTFVGAILLPLLLSGAMELLQEYATVNRSGDWADMIANSIGVILAALLGYLVFPRWMKQKN